MLSRTGGSRFASRSERVLRRRAFPRVQRPRGRRRAARGQGGPKPCGRRGQSAAVPRGTGGAAPAWRAAVPMMTAELALHAALAREPTGREGRRGTKTWLGCCWPSVRTRIRKTRTTPPRSPSLRRTATCVPRAVAEPSDARPVVTGVGAPCGRTRSLRSCSRLVPRLITPNTTAAPADRTARSLRATRADLVG